MTLHEAIQRILIENKRPMRARDIAHSINITGLYNRKDGKIIETSQVYARIKNYPSLFQNVNGYIVLVNDNTWKNLITSYDYLTHILKGIFIQADIQFIIATLFYYKRLIDTRRNLGNNFSTAFFYNLLATHDTTRTSNAILQNIKEMESYDVAPVGVFDECVRLLDKLDNNQLREILVILRDIQTRNFNDQEFGNVFEYLINIISIDDKTILNHTSFSLRQLMVELLDISDGSSLYDPVAGIGDLLIEAVSEKSNISAYGSEINKRTAQLGNMNVIMHGLKNISINAENSFDKITDGKKYDYILGDLPFNATTTNIHSHQLYQNYNLANSKYVKSFGAIVLLALSKLNNDGKAVLTVSDGFLSKKGVEQEIREVLIREDIIESIISLPYGTLRPYTDAKASIIVLNRKKNVDFKNRIQFIIGRPIEQTSKSLILNNEEILHSYNGKIVFGKNTQAVHIDNLRPDSNLLAEIYDAQFLLARTMLIDGKAKLLSDLVQIKAGVTPEKSIIDRDGEVPLIKIEKLSKDILDIGLDISNGENVIDEKKYERNLINEDCILVARIGDNLKATIFRPSNNIPRILLHSNLYALIPNKKSELSIEYLYYQLHSTFIQDQIEKRKLGAVMPYISIAGLKEIVIPYMTLEAQHEFVQSQKANLIAEERNRVEDKIKALGYKEETKQAEADVIKILTHQLRPTFAGLNSITKRIGRIIERENIGDLKEYESNQIVDDPEIEYHLSVPDNFTLQQLIDKLTKDTRHISDILSNIDKVMNFKLLQEDLKDVNVLDFLMDYKKQKEMEENLKYSIDVKGDSVIALIHTASFKELIDTLLLNADKHAFSDNVSNNNNVQFIVKSNKRREVVSIEYQNNGKPFELTQRDFTTAFEKGNKSNGSGIGGNYISRIVDAHKGKMVVEEKNTKGFSLTIELPTPNNKIYE